MLKLVLICLNFVLQFPISYIVVNKTVRILSYSLKTSSCPTSIKLEWKLNNSAEERRVIFVKQQLH